MATAKNVENVENETAVGTSSIPHQNGTTKAAEKVSEIIDLEEHLTVTVREKFKRLVRSKAVVAGAIAVITLAAGTFVVKQRNNVDETDDEDVSS